MKTKTQKTIRPRMLGEDNLDHEDCIKLRVMQARRVVELLRPFAVRGQHDSPAIETGFDLLEELLGKIERDAGAILDHIEATPGRKTTPRVKSPKKAAAKKPHWKTVAKAEKLAEAANGAAGGAQ